MLKPEKSFVLSVNGGSSSIKFALFDTGTSLHRVLRGRIERIGMPAAMFTVQGTNRADVFSRPVSAPDHTAAVGVLMDWIEGQIASGALAAIGHRVVHGGPAYWEAQRITPTMICRAWPACCRSRGVTTRKASGATAFTASPAPTSWKNSRGWTVPDRRRGG